MRTRHPDATIEWRELMSYPALGGTGESAIERLCSALAGDDPPAKVAFGTEAGLFAQAGIPTVVIGPGSIEQAHKADEFIAVSELEACGGFLDRLIAYCRR
jgi:acetylornithine deacetylase